MCWFHDQKPTLFQDIMMALCQRSSTHQKIARICTLTNLPRTSHTVVSQLISHFFQFFGWAFLPCSSSVLHLHCPRAKSASSPDTLFQFLDLCELSLTTFQLCHDHRNKPVNIPKVWFGIPSYLPSAGPSTVFPSCLTVLQPFQSVQTLRCHGSPLLSLRLQNYHITQHSVLFPDPALLLLCPLISDCISFIPSLIQFPQILLCRS